MLELSNLGTSKLSRDDDSTSETAKLDKSSDMFIKCRWLGENSMYVFFISLSVNMDETSLWNKIRDRLHCSLNHAAGVEVLDTIKLRGGAPRTISSAPKIESSWQACRGALLEGRVRKIGAKV